MNNESIQGSLSVSQDCTVGGDSHVRGSSVIDHDLTIKGWLDARNIKGVCKGLYATEESLRQTYPQPQPGWFAFVGNTLPAAVYRVKGCEWVATGEQGGQFTLYSEQLVADLDQLKKDVATAKSTADTASTTANAAKTTADAASKTADTAFSKSNSAQTTASEAKVAALNAYEAAATAKTTADAAKTTAATAQQTAGAAKAAAAALEESLLYGGGMGMIGRFRGVLNELEIPTPGSGDPDPFDVLTPGSTTRIWFCANVRYMVTGPQTRGRGTFVAEHGGHYYLNWSAKPLYGILDSRGYNNGASAASDEATMFNRLGADNFAVSAGIQPGGVFIDTDTGNLYLSDNTSSDGYMVVKAAGDGALWHE